MAAVATTPTHCAGEIEKETALKSDNPSGGATGHRQPAGHEDLDGAGAVETVAAGGHRRQREALGLMKPPGGPLRAVQTVQDERDSLKLSRSYHNLRAIERVVPKSVWPDYPSGEAGRRPLVVH